jgi:hypothetical protein
VRADDPSEAVNPVRADAKGEAASAPMAPSMQYHRHQQQHNMSQAQADAAASRPTPTNTSQRLSI